MSTSLVPPLSTIFNLWPVMVSILISLSLILCASSECFVKGMNITALMLLLLVFFLLVFLPFAIVPLLALFGGVGGVYSYLLSSFSLFLLLSPLYQSVFSNNFFSVLSFSVSLAERYCPCPLFSLLSIFLSQPTIPQVITSLACFLSYPEFFSWEM